MEGVGKGVGGSSGGAKREPEDLMSIPVESVRISTPSTSTYQTIRQRVSELEMQD